MNDKLNLAQKFVHGVRFFSSVFVFFYSLLNVYYSEHYEGFFVSVPNFTSHRRLRYSF